MNIILTFASLLTFLLLIAAVTDARRFIIPNWLNGVILLLYPAMIFAVPGGHSVEWLHALYAFGGALAIGFLFFAFGFMGGGDIKLLCALSLWIGLSRPLADFAMFSSLFGGLLTILLIVGRFFVASMMSKRKKAGKIPRALTYGEPVPYGIAIAAGFLVVLWTGHVPGLAGIEKPLKPLISQIDSLFE